MKIGTYYSLPDGRKGMYVGADDEGDRAYAALLDDEFEIYYTNETLEEYREPRVFEDEVLVVQHGQNDPFMIFATDLYKELKVLARRKITIEEGEGL